MTLPENPRALRIGTRASPLAMRQAEMVRDALIAAHGAGAIAPELVPMVATGDRIQDRALAEVGGKALWTRELDMALADGRIDCAVHSMKDVETHRPDTFALAAVLPRADVRDRLIGADSLDALAPGARVGTSSPRRAAQLQRLRPDLVITLLRGNVGTRLAKLAAGDVEATLLAAAGLDRLGMADTGTAIGIDTLLPAPQQGVIGIEVRRDDDGARAAIAAIDHAPTHRCLAAERALLAALGGDCRSPVAALALIGADGDALWLRAILYDADGSDHVAGEWRGSDMTNGPAALARDLLSRAGAGVRAMFAP